MQSFKVFLLCSVFGLFGSSTQIFSQQLPSYVETRMGKFPLEIPALMLPELQPLRLASVPDPAFPELPLWHLEPQLRPPRPSWLDRGGEEVEVAFERLVSIQSENYHEKRENLHRAIRQFAKVVSEYPDTHWRVLATFWGSYAQLQLIRAEAEEKRKTGEPTKRKLCQKNESLVSLRQRLKQLLEEDSASEYRSQTVVLLAWMSLFERCYDQVTQKISQYNQLVVRRSKEHEKLLKFGFYAYFKKGDYNEAVATLQKLKTLFPQQHSYTVAEANLHYQTQQREALEQLGSRMASRLFNHAETQYILELVLRSHLESRQWDKAQEVLKQLGSRGGVSDLELLGHGEIAIQQNNLELAFRSIQGIRDLFLRTKMWKRLVHKTAMQADYRLLLSFNRASTLQKDAEYHLIHGYALYQDGLHLRAYDAFQQAFTSSQGGEVWIREQALFLRSTIELHSRDFEQAEKHLQELLSEFEESSQRSEYYFWLGVLQLEQRQSLRSIHLSMRQVDPEGVRGDGRWYVLGFSSHEMNEWGKAIAFFKQLLEKHSQSLFREESFYRLADAYYQQGQHLEADQILSEYREEFQQLSNAVRVIERQAQNMVKLGRLQKAHALLLKEVPIHPDFRLVALHLDILNQLQDDLGMLELAIRTYNYDFLSDQRGLISYHQANSLFRMKRFEESLSSYLEAQRDPPPDRLRFIKYRIIQVHHTLNHYAQFSALSEGFIQENQNDGKGNRILAWLSDYYEQEGKLSQAIPHWKQLAVNYQATAGQVSLPMEKRLELIIRIGGLYNKLADYKEAERWVDQGFMLNEKVGGEGQRGRTLKLLKEKGIAAYGLGQHKRALAASLKVSYLNRAMPESEAYQLHLRIANSYQQLGRVREAKAIYRKLLQRLQNTQRRGVVQQRLKTLENG